MRIIFNSIYKILKKVIAYERLLWASISNDGQKPVNFLIYTTIFFMIIFLDNKIFLSGTPANTILPIAFPIISICIINSIVNSSNRLFETVPVSKKYTVVNIFILSIVNVVILIISIWAFVVTIIWIIVILFPSHITNTPPEIIKQQIIITTKGNILLMLIAIIVIFVGTAITFIKNKKYKICSFTMIGITVYGFLFLLKSFMPISPKFNKVEFFYGLSAMTNGNLVLVCLGILTAIISTISIIVAFRLYSNKGDRGIRC